ncbi:MAG: hypothetical protein M3067_02290 [Chloroflexota bacterium]|nr:hypothetical protein [Chloroflexota bacterium]
MDRRTVRFFLLVLAAIVTLAVGAAVLGGRSPASVRPIDVPTVDGIVVGVESAGLGNVSGFSIRTDDGRTLRFGLSTLADAVQFPPGHLGEHLANSVRVRVWYRDAAGRLDALWLEDAPAT